MSGHSLGEVMRTCIILGGASCVWDDAKAASFDPDVVIAINDIGTVWPHVDYWVTFHPEKWDKWRGERDRVKLPPARVHVSHAPPADVVMTKWTMPGSVRSGGSALLAVKVAMELAQCDRIVLAGCPIDGKQSHYFDSQVWPDADNFTTAWREAVNHIGSCTRSMSGFTRELLGAPDVNWLAGSKAELK